MIALLDVNVLIALVDPDHVHHAPAKAFFASTGRDGWATCPLTENGFLRIIGRRSYLQGPGSPQAARTLLANYLAAPGHQFWPDDLSLADARAFPALPGPQSLTDFYLLALAVKHRARFATFEGRIDPALIPGGSAACFIIPPA